MDGGISAVQPPCIVSISMPSYAGRSLICRPYKITYFYLFLFANNAFTRSQSSPVSFFHLQTDRIFGQP